MLGRQVVTSGAVTRVDDNGFFLQDPTGDGDPRTPDAVFVFTGTSPTVKAGQCVRLGGRVVEFRAGGGAKAAPPVTELHDVSAVQVLGDGCEPKPVEVALPLSEGLDPRLLQGMLVNLHGPLTVQQNYFLGRFGQLTLAAGGRLQAPTHRFRPGPAARALARDNAARQVLLDDGSTRQHPASVPFLGGDGTVRAGDQVAEVTGVIDVGPAEPGGSSPAWKILPTKPLRWLGANPRTAAPAPVGGTLKVAGVNVDNFFSTPADGRAGCLPSRTPADCRGARSPLEFGRQRAKLVAELAAIDADIVGLMEIENNGPTALQALVDALNARAGVRAYARVADPPEGSGRDAIKVALIYKSARVRPVGPARSDSQAVHDRWPLAQTFEAITGAATRARLNVVVSHFKSRRCGGATGVDLDQGDLQGCWNHRRVLQAQALRRFAAGLAARSGVEDTLLIGDFNAYAREDPLRQLAVRGAAAGSAAPGFVDEAARFDPSGYSFVFDSAAGRLDQVFASAALSARVTGVAEWHINADEPPLLDYSLAFRAPACAACAPDRYAPTPYRASDHDPVVVGLRLGR
ncbi:MAG: ExeM/NucH family extracellular endonuclease [Burkholderiaceae bacterium]